MDITSTMHNILKKIDVRINDTSISKQQRASYVIGATEARTDFDEIAELEPLLIELTNIAFNLEIEHHDKYYINSDFNSMLNIIDKLKIKYKYVTS